MRVGISFLKMNSEWTHPLIRAGSAPVTGADVPFAPRPAMETVGLNSSGGSAREIQSAPCPVPFGPFLPPEPRDCVIADPARTPMTPPEILRWNKLVSKGSNEPVVYSGVPLVRYSDLGQGRSGGDMNNTTHRGNEFGVLGRLDADGRPVVATDMTWVGQPAPMSDGARIVVANPFYPLPDQDVQEIAWKFEHPNLMTREGQPVYNYSESTWEGFTGDMTMERVQMGMKQMMGDITNERLFMGVVVAFVIFILWKMGKKNL